MKKILFAGSLFVAVSHAALVSHFSYAGERAKEPCVPLVGKAAVVCDAQFLPVEGVGPLTNGTNAVWIPVGASLRVEHGLKTDANPDWCMAVKVRTASAHPSEWHCFYSTMAGKEDGALFLRNRSQIGSNVGWSGYRGVSWADDTWHTVVVSVDAKAPQKQVYLDGNFLHACGPLRSEALFGRPYFYFSGDNNGEDGLLGIGEIRIWDESFPKELFPNGGTKDPIGSVADDIRKIWEAHKGEAHAPRFEFDRNDEFTFLHVTDIQENGKLHPVSARVLRAAIRRFRPQLAVLTGDNVNSGANAHGRFEQTIEPFVSIFREGKVAFCVTFGNHDSERGGYTRQEQYDLYKLAGGSLFVDHDVPILTGVGNGFVDVAVEGNVEPSVRLFVMDSGSYPKQGGYDGCRTDQIEWFEKVVGDVPFFWFQHIIVPDVNTTGILEGGRLAEGVLGEKKEGTCPPSVAVYENEEHTFEGRTLYQSWLRSNCLIAAYFGHDHKNTFDGTDKNGVRMGATKALTLCSYNDGNPGLRVITVKPNGSYETQIFTAADLTDSDL